MKRIARLRLVYLALTATVVVADQIVKRVIDRTMDLHETRSIIAGLLQLTYVRNRGGAFGLLSSADLPMQNTLFMALNLITLGAILIYALRTPPQRLRLQSALGLVMGGAIGNFIDRFTRSYVIDFVDVYWKSHHWPMFNVADSAISVGVALLILDMLREPRPSSEGPEGEAVGVPTAGRQ
jgi:signal peptidase II